jgi:histidinol-phosphate aminotransferase
MSEAGAVLDRIKPAIRVFRPDHRGGVQVDVKLDQNENPYDFPVSLKDEVMAAVAKKAWGRYPSARPEILTAALSRFVGWPAEGIVLGNGSNELIHAILVAACGAGRRLVTVTPTFGLYKLHATFLDSEVHEVPLRPDLSFDATAIRAEADRVNADVIAVCSPNNPTGSILGRDELESIVRGFGGFVVVDEAYHEFAGTSFVPLLERYKNLLLLRTFSKAMGLAGVRIGYLLAHRQAAEQIEKAKVPFSVNLFSCEAARVALEHFSLVEERIRLIVSERDRLMAGLARVQQIRAYPSAANFILFDVIGDRQQVLRGLIERGVLIRDVSSPGLLANAVRVSVGTPAENDRFLHALRDVVSVFDPPARTDVAPAREPFV